MATDRFGGLLVDDAPASGVDRFGGIVLDQPKPSRFGGVPIDEPFNADQLGSDIYATIHANQDKAASQGLDPYQNNIGIAADAQSDSRNWLTKSFLYRTGEGAASAVGSTFGGAVGSGLSELGVPGFGEATDQIRNQQNVNSVERTKRNAGSSVKNAIQSGVDTLATAMYAGATGGLGAMAAAFGGSTALNTLSEARSRGESTGDAYSQALVHGGLDAAWTLVGGKLLGAGLSKLAGATGENVAGRAAKKIAEKHALPEWPAEFVSGTTRIKVTGRGWPAELAGGAAGQVAQGIGQGASQYLASVGLGEREFDARDFTESMTSTIAPSLIAGAAGPAVHKFVGKIAETFQARADALRAAREAFVENPSRSNAAKLGVGEEAPTKAAREELAQSLKPKPISTEEAQNLGWRKAFHGTSQEVRGQFKVGKSGDYEGVYFTDTPEAARGWIDWKGGKEGTPHIVEAYLNLKNPASFEDVRQAKAALNEKVGDKWTPKQLTEELKSRGFDGVVDDSYAGNEVVVFDPSQIAADLPQDSKNDRFRGLANQTENPEVRAANFGVDVEMGIPERKKWADAEAVAQQRIAADQPGELNRFLAKIDEAQRTGGTIDIRDMADAATLNRLKESAAVDLSTPEGRELHRTLHQAFRSARTEQARSLAYRDPLANLTPEQRNRKSLADAMAEPTTDEAAELSNARTPEERSRVSKKAEQRYQAIAKKLAGMGIDLYDLDGIAADPKKTMLVLDHFRTSTNVSDKLYEYWRNAILSGPRTQVTNAVGNTLFAGWNLGPERAVEAGINLFAGKKNAASFGEFKHLAGGILPGIMRGLKNARTAWALETSSLADSLGREGAFKVDGARGAIPGKLGRMVRAFGYRPLLAADEFAKSVIVQMEVGAHAYREGKGQGLKGPELQQLIQEKTADLNSTAWDQAFAKAEELTFQGRKGIISESLSSGANKLRRIRGVRWVVPFVDTPASIIEQGVKRTPVLGAILDYAEARRKGLNMADAGMTQTMARQLIGMAAVAAVWDGVDDENPWITGSTAHADQKDRSLAYRSAPPTSIRIGDTWYDYSKIEPFATALSLTVDAVHGMKNGQPITEPLIGFGQQLKNKSYLDGLGDAVDAVQGLSSGDTGSAEEWASKFASSWVPNTWRQTVAATSGQKPETRVWGKEDEHFLRTLKRTAQSAQLIDQEPQYDVWGRPIRYTDSWGNGATDFMWNLLSPVKAKDASKVMQADLALMRWNAQNPADRRVLSEPGRSVKWGGKVRYLTDEQFAEYSQLAGQYAQRAVQRVAVNPDKPSLASINRIDKAVDNARALARKQLINKWRVTWK